MYEILLSPPVERYLKKIKDKRLLAAFGTAFDKLKKEPYKGAQKAGDLSGVYCYDVKYASVKYKIAYRIFEVDGRYIIIILAGSRDNFYEELKRLVN